MSASVLVGYATRYGSTQEVGEALSATLREQRLEVHIQSMWKVRTLAGYSAIVLGAPLYMFHWHKDALHFLSRHREALTERPVQIFALDSITTGDEKEWQGSRDQLDKMEDEMDIQVLVAYATKYGATAEIAEKIGQVLRQAGLPTDVLPVADVSDLTPYEAVVLGSAVYMGKWRKEAVKFLQANEKMLAERQVWLFSSGPVGEGDAVELTEGWRFPKALQPLADRIRPRDIAVFHGVINMNKLNPIEKWMFKKFESPVGDFRDWETITSWATDIANVMKEAVS